MQVKLYTAKIGNIIIKNLILISALLIPSAIFAQKVPTSEKTKVDNIVKAMTIQEKVSLLVGIGEKTYRNPLKGEKTVLAPGAAGYTFSIPRLGVTSVAMSDGPSGVRLYPGADDYKETFCTAFPSAIALGSSWNTKVISTVGAAIGKEAREYGVDVLLAPGMNLQRNPLCGRNFEYYSEDPLINGRMAAAFTSGVQQNGVGACLKVLFAYNQETKRREYNAVISQRAIREIYLRSFEIAIKESHPWTIMTAYNMANGLPTSENRDLLTTIARKEWGFKGLFMTDWLTNGDGAAKIRAGNNLLMWGTEKETKEIYKGLKDKTISMEMIDNALKPVVELILKSLRYNKIQPSGNLELEDHSRIARETAGESMVLLKNNKETLPLNGIKTIALYGKTSYDFIPNGLGSAEVYYKHAVSLKEGLMNAGYKIERNTGEIYQFVLDSILNQAKVQERKQYEIALRPEIQFSKANIEKYQANADIALVTIGRISSEGGDQTEQDYFCLSSTEKNLIGEVCQVYHGAGKKVVVILNTGSIIDVATWKDMPDAIIMAWQTGQEGGNALCDILSGKVNPSGKITASFPLKYADVPSSGTFPGEKNSVNSYYSEGIYVGYRYYETFKVPTAFEFGYGLSYTQFEYSNLRLSNKIFKNSITVKVKVKNNGKFAGKEVVQLYIAAPNSEIDKPKEELKGFAKTKLLLPGEEQELVFTLTSRLLASFWSGISSWVADKGEYEVRIGASSKDIRLKDLFSVPQSIIVEKLNDVIFPNYPPNLQWGSKTNGGDKSYDKMLNLN